jgi:hypothetical protein
MIQTYAATQSTSRERLPLPTTSLRSRCVGRHMGLRSKLLYIDFMNFLDRILMVCCPERMCCALQDGLRARG